jgi:DNA modification methylase
MNSSRLETAESKPVGKSRRHCNDLDGKHWIQNSISVWSDIRKTAEEAQLKHPAMFPAMLADRLIETFLPPEGSVVLDPFSGSGSTLIAAQSKGRQGIGLDLSPEYVALAKTRLSQLAAEQESAANASRQPRSAISPARVYEDSAENLLSYVEPNSVDLCISSPPYWNILNQRRSADLKKTRHYGNLDGDIGTIEDYDAFLTATTNVFDNVLKALKPGAYCCVVVMDLRKKKHFFPLHSDLSNRLLQVGYLYDDLIIWNRQSEYNNLRPLGYPSVFRVNKVHEFVLLTQKPKHAVP